MTIIRQTSYNPIRTIDTAKELESIFNKNAVEGKGSNMVKLEIIQGNLGVTKKGTNHTLKTWYAITILEDITCGNL